MNANKVAEKINAIRRAAGNPLAVCPTCGHAPHAPYRRIVGGRIAEGCVDALRARDLAGLNR